ncbi:MAG: RNA methyltransferase [Bacteroidales bacterium]|nr:RNA methyltransferase [Bacteroidales bacterium]
MEQLFVAEGSKIVLDFLKSGLKLVHLCAYPEWIKEHQNSIKNLDNQTIDIGESEMKKISHLHSPSPVLATFKIKKNQMFDFKNNTVSSVLFLDGIQDPGNLGTLIRTADWFGIKNIVCTNNSVDCYNPKVVQSTMGSLARVHISYSEIDEFFKIVPADFSIVGSYMEGTPIGNFSFPSKSILIIGSEGKGISSDTASYITHKISIPRLSKNNDKNSIDSLNASVAGAIICYEYSKNR